MNKSIARHSLFINMLIILSTISSLGMEGKHNLNDDPERESLQLAQVTKRVMPDDQKDTTPPSKRIRIFLIEDDTQEYAFNNNANNNNNNKNSNNDPMVMSDADLSPFEKIPLELFVRIINNPGITLIDI
jgi:hypothetical protein